MIIYVMLTLVLFGICYISFLPVKIKSINFAKLVKIFYIFQKLKIFSPKANILLQFNLFLTFFLDLTQNQL